MAQSRGAAIGDPDIELESGVALKVNDGATFDPHLIAIDDLHQAVVSVIAAITCNQVVGKGRAAIGIRG